MSDAIREPEQIRQDTARKLRAVQISGHFQAILGCLLSRLAFTPITDAVSKALGVQ